MCSLNLNSMQILFEIETSKRRKNTNKWVNSTLKLKRFCGITGNRVIKLLKLLKLPAKYVKLKVRVEIRAAQIWFQKFNKGDLSLQNKVRTGRTLSIDPDELRTAVESNPSTITRELSVELQTSSSTVFRHLKMMGKINRSPKDVPRDLTQQQEQRRVQICKELLKNPNDDRFLKRIVTCDEKWILLNNPNLKRHWLDPKQPALPVPRRDRFDTKFMLCVWWNYEGIIHFELL